MFGGLRVPFDLNMLVLALGAVIGFWGLMELTEAVTGDANIMARVWNRLTGGDSVVWGLRNQFRVMAPAPTRRRTTTQSLSGPLRIRTASPGLASGRGVKV